jgi:hypothetical protein
VGRHLLRVLEGVSIGEVGGDPGCAKVRQPSGAARIIRQASGWLIGLSESAVSLWPPGAEQPSLTVRGDAGGSMYARSTSARAW